VSTPLVDLGKGGEKEGKEAAVEVAIAYYLASEEARSSVTMMCLKKRISMVARLL